MKELDEIQEKFDASLSKIETTDDLNEVRTEFLGKSGYLTNAMKLIKDMTNEAKKDFGVGINNLKTKVLEMIENKKLELEKWILPDADVKANIETAFMSALYMYFRNLYNDKEVQKNTELYTAIFLFIRNYSYSGMFRYNDSGEFNVPYGGASYNSKTLNGKIQYYKSERVLNKFLHTTIFNLDFEDFFKKNKPQKNDFVFLDPPYDSEFSTYAKNIFSKEDQARLANYLCNECKANWMLVIKSTPYILSLYENKGLTIKQFDKTYAVSFMNRNNKNVEHLIIMNY